MKKILIAMALFALMALPMSAMAMTSIDDSDLSTVTGQAGVSIGADISMDLDFGTVAWGDIDGTAGYAAGSHDTNTTNGGWVGIRNLAINNLRIHLRSDSGMFDAVVANELNSSYSLGGSFTTAADWGTAIGAGDAYALKAGLLSALATEQLLTIDIYSTSQTKTYVRIGLPTFEITMGDMTLDVGLASNVVTTDPFTGATSSSPHTTWQSMGSVFIDDLTVYVDKDNYVDISQNNTSSGVLIQMDNKTAGGTLARVGFSAVSWGDLDGLNAWPSNAPVAGYVGLSGMALAVTVDNLAMNINVGTSTGYGLPAVLGALTVLTDAASVMGYVQGTLLPGLAANSPQLKDDLAYLLWTRGTISKTSVDIALSGTIGISTMNTQVRLANNAALAGSYLATGNNAGILGNLYISGMNMTFLGDATGAVTGAPQSWVSISAH